MHPSPRLLTLFRWLGMADAALMIVIGLFGEGILFLPPRVRPLLISLVIAGAVFGMYAWISAHKTLVPVATAGIFALASANFALSVLWGERYAPTLEPDPDTVYRLIPDTVKLSRNPKGEWIRWQVNSRGYRGPEIGKDSATRIIVYGDSFVQAEFSRVEDTFCAQLSDQLAARLNESVEVINAGVNGYGPDQSLRRMEGDISALQPRLTLLVVFAGNDFGDLIRNRLYRLGPAGELTPNRFTLSSRQMRAFYGSRYRPVLLNAVEMAWRTWRKGRSTPHEVEEILLRQREFEDSVINRNDEIDNISTDSNDLDVAVDPTGPAAAYKIRLMERVLERCARVAADNNSAFAILIIPRVEDLADDKALNADEFPDYRPSNLTDVVETIAKRQNIPYANAYSGFRRAGPDSVYFHDFGDNHWNAVGQRLAAELVADVLTAGDPPLLSPSRAGNH